MQKVLSFFLAGVLLLSGGVISPAFASSHREAPLISQDPLADTTDVYAFVSPEATSTVTLISNYIPLEEPASGPNFWKFDDNVLYEIKVDNDADCVADVTYQFRFRTEVANPNTFLYNTGVISNLEDPDWNIRQYVTVTEVTETGKTVLGANLYTPPVNIGPASLPNYDSVANAAIHSLSGGIKVFAGQRDEAFYVDLGAVFDLLQLRTLTGDLPAIDATAGFNVHSIAIQVPKSRVVGPSGIIGVWATASRLSVPVIPGSSKPWRQVSRLAMPLVNEVVIPLGDKDKWNSSNPVDDGQFLDYVIDPELAKLYTLLFGVNVPPAPRDDLVAVFLTGVAGLNQPPNVTACEQIRLNTTIAPTGNPNRLGVLAGDLAGYPNGRRVGDDTVDISLRAVAGVLVNGFNIPPNNSLSDGINANDKTNLGTFPYLPSPTSGYDSPHGSKRGPSLK